MAFLFLCLHSKPLPRAFIFIPLFYEWSDQKEEVLFDTSVIKHFSHIIRLHIEALGKQLKYVIIVFAWVINDPFSVTTL